MIKVVLLAALLPCGCVSAGEQRTTVSVQVKERKEFCWPLAEFRYSLNRPTGGWLAQRGRNSHHLGVDMFASVGQPVRAIADGVVHDISESGWGRGNVAIMVKHRLADGRWFIALYGHVRNIFGLRKGSRVQSCGTIALVGPYRCGSHVHLGIIAPGRLPHAPYGTSKMHNHNNFINPVRFLQTGQPEEPGKDEEPLKGEQTASVAVPPQCAGQNLAEGSEEEDKLVESVLNITDSEEPVAKTGKAKQHLKQKKNRHHTKAAKVSKKKHKKSKAVVKAKKGRAKHSVSASARKKQAAKHQSGKSKGQKKKQKARKSSAKKRAARKR